MTLNDLLESGVCLQGHIKIQRWDNDVEPTVFYDDDVMEFYPYYLNKHENIIDCEIFYMFSYMKDYDTPAICIEISED